MNISKTEAGALDRQDCKLPASRSVADMQGWYFSIFTARRL